MFFGPLKRRDYLFTRYTWKIIQERIYRITRF